MQHIHRYIFAKQWYVVHFKGVCQLRASVGNASFCCNFVAFDQRTNKLLAGLVLSGTWLKIALEPAHK